MYVKLVNKYGVKFGAGVLFPGVLDKTGPNNQTPIILPLHSALTNYQWHIYNSDRPFQNIQ